MQKRLDIKTRSARRKRCRLKVEVQYFNQKAPARVVDLSEHGLAMDLDGPFSASSGSMVKISNPQLGVLEGTVQWSRSNRLGVRFSLNSNSSALVSSYFRFFHQDVKPVLTR